MVFQISWYEKSDSSKSFRNFRVIGLSDGITIGREEGANIVLKDPAVSRLHAEIFVNSSGVNIKDAGSANGIKLNGNTIQQTVWLPGQTLTIGSYIFELAPHTAPAEEIKVDQSRPSVIVSRLDDPSPRGRVVLGDVYRRARSNDRHAVKELFSGFLGENEQVIDCGFLGSIGFIFPEHSFWCVTDSRVCGLLLNRGGWMMFNFGFIKALNRAVFVQPSLVGIWVTLVLWAIFVILFAGSVARSALYLFDVNIYVSLILSIIFFAAIFALGVLLVPFVIRAFYRWVKAGCIFWTVEQVPIVIFSDRQSLKNAQRFIRTFMDQKQLLGD